MSTVITQVKIQRDNGLNRDAVINTWHHTTDGDPPTSAELDSIASQLIDFYTASVPAVGAALMSFMAKYLNGPAEYKMYDVGDPTPRTPIRTGTFTFTPPTTGTALPAEVALVLSIRAPLISGVDARRLRNRVYIGPFNAGTAVADTGDARPDPGLIGCITGAAKRMMDAGNAAGASKLAVYSAAGFSVYTANKCIVNDAWDTQRRRGANPTANTVVLKA